MKPKISVIVPVYNVEQFLSKCIDSIINQTYENLEIILVNDGSPDNCGFICDEYGKKDNRIKVIHQKNKGLSGARNSGLEIASGDYIGFIDSDDWIHEKMYDTLITQLLLHQCDLTNCITINSNQTWENEPLENYKPIILDKKALLYNYLDYGFYIVRNLYSRELMKDLRFDENIPFVEDMFFGINVVEKIDRSVFINFPLYIYNQDNTSSLTRVKYNKNTFISLKANNYIKKKTLAIFPNDIELQSVIRNRIIGNCLYHFQNLYHKSNIHLDKDDMMKRKSKQAYNDNFAFFKNPSVFKTIIRLLNVSQLNCFYRTYFALNKKRIESKC
ncbi:glycosyltransferase family 2 protein [Gelidibacter maritimus]|uniref:Glycosyltransferase n=1 Tax=Gelidibacter maritimus TaxID=2761487 RepID=A0A7W2M6H1_9FLAO|nr:glycosyltransferase [Gelidibacter maritimus]MBA6153572.1 glycosyltransferase [Gelidibacter maritimus]